MDPDALFKEALDAFDNGDIQKLGQLLTGHPGLTALWASRPAKGYFAHPYLPWFIADNPIRRGTLPSNVVGIANLLAQGVNPNSYPHPDSGFHSHATALHQAVWSGNPEAVRLLLAAGADPSATDKIYEGTPLGWALHGLGETTDPKQKEGLTRIVELLRPVSPDPAGWGRPAEQHGRNVWTAPADEDCFASPARNRTAYRQRKG